jgi:peroxiredoxin
MAQLRHDYPEFKELNTEVLVVLPNGPKMIERHVNRHAPPYPILSDKGAQVAEQYAIHIKQAIVLTTMTPTVFLVDTSRVIRYARYGTSYIEEPDNGEPLAVLAQMRAAAQVLISP